MSVARSNLIRELSAWAFGIGIIVFSLIYFHELRDITRTLLNLPAPSDLVASTKKRVPSSGSSSPYSQIHDGATVELRAGPHGHFRTTAQINGSPTDVLVDSGASLVALPYEAARAAGINPGASDFTMRSHTANGVSYFAPVVIDEIEINGLVLYNVKGSVASPGRLNITLLGNSFLSKLGRYEVRSGVLYMEE